MSFGAVPFLTKSGRSVSAFVRIAWQIAGWPNFLRRLQWRPVCRLLETSPGLTIADVGAGPMQLSVELAKSGSAVVAIDMSLPPSAEDFARRFNIRILAADACALPIANAQFDRVLMSSLIQMVPDPEKLLDETRRILKPGGFLVATVPDHYRFIPSLIANPFIRSLFNAPVSVETLEAQLNARFQVLGPRGYYTREALSDLLSRGGFEIAEETRTPGFVGTLIWELGVLAHLRFGSIALDFLFLFYPFAYLCDILFPAEKGSELIIKAVPKNEV